MGLLNSHAQTGPGGGADEAARRSAGRGHCTETGASKDQSPGLKAPAPGLMRRDGYRAGDEAKAAERDTLLSYQQGFLGGGSARFMPPDKPLDAGASSPGEPGAAAMGGPSPAAPSSAPWKWLPQTLVSPAGSS